MAHEHEPYTLNNVLEYDGKYYVVGSGRQPLQKDKTQTEDYYLLTLAAIAKELILPWRERQRSSIWQRDCRSPALAGIKKPFREYLYRGGEPVCFRYEGLDYIVSHLKCRCFRRAMPQR